MLDARQTFVQCIRVHTMGTQQALCERVSEEMSLLPPLLCFNTAQARLAFFPVPSFFHPLGKRVFASKAGPAC